MRIPLACQSTFCPFGRVSFSSLPRYNDFFPLFLSLPLPLATTPIVTTRVLEYPYNCVSFYVCVRTTVSRVSAARTPPEPPLELRPPSSSFSPSSNLTRIRFYQFIDLSTLRKRYENITLDINERLLLCLFTTLNKPSK